MRRRHTRLSFAGSIHFITTVTRIRGAWFVEEEICTRILKFLEWHRAKHSLECIGYVLMPDHLHVLLYQSNEGMQIPQMMAVFKRETSKQLRPKDYPGVTLWNDHYDDVPVPGLNAVVTKLEYMHNNPIRRVLVEEQDEYRWSSARNYFDVEKGIVRITRP
ncbi:transposase [bacterium]|nr:transposase [bacterium]